MGRPAKEPFMTIRHGNVEMVLQVVASTKKEALDLRPAADVWVDSPSNSDALFDAVSPWIQRVAAFVKDRATENRRQQALPFGEP